MAVRATLEEAFRGTGCEFDGFDDDGAIAVEIDDVSVDVEIVDDEQRVVLSAAIGTVADDDAATLRLLLSGNLFWRGGNGATLALDDGDAGRIVLLRTIPEEQLDAASLQTAIGDMADAVAAWRDYLANKDSDDGAPRPPFGDVMGRAGAIKV